jgi:serine/threonine protein kinase
MRKFFWSRDTEPDLAAALKPAGVSLAEKMAGGALPLAEALRHAIATGEALRAVHARGRAYGVLQPANVILQDGGYHLVPAGLVVITPYFSPEQLMGRDIDPRSDIFSLGALLYEMLSGRKAFEAPTKPALRFEILDREPAPLEHVPPVLSHLVMRCLEKKPERRVQRMEVLLASLKLQEIIAAPVSRSAAGKG